MARFKVGDLAVVIDDSKAIDYIGSKGKVVTITDISSDGFISAEVMFSGKKLPGMYPKRLIKIARVHKISRFYE